MTEEETMDPDYYDTDYGDQLCRKDEVVKVGSIIIPVIFSLVVVLSCIGNILVLVILALYESLKSLTNVFILNLALSDLLFTFGLPFWTSYFVWGWTFGEIGCKAVKFLFYVGFYSSVLFLTLMTIQRYMAVVHPLSDWEKCRGFSVAPFIVWILSGGLSLLGSFNSTMPILGSSTSMQHEIHGEESDQDPRGGDG
ncbi:chemokine XC receptor [Pimephales promelas]|nr:chemokine XC receptor [Pimephales promelas]